MKQIKVSEATGKALDWLVAEALGHSLKIRTWRDITDRLDAEEDADIIAFHKERNTVRVPAEQIPGGGWYPNRPYSTDWSQGGPVMDRERIGYFDVRDTRGYVQAAKPGAEFVQRGPTPLIAAMRCFVASKLGGTAEVPEELLASQEAGHA